MPSSIIVAVVAAVSQAAGASLAAFFATTIGGIVKAAIGMVFSLGLSMLTASKPKGPAPFEREAVDRLQTVRSSIEPHRVIYGQIRVAGALTFATSSGAKNDYWHMTITLAGHEVEEIGDIWINDEVIPLADFDTNGNVTAGKYAGLIRVKRYLGRDDQLADPTLISEAPNGEWTSADRGRGRAYIYVRVQYDRDLFASGLPNVTAVVKGRKVYDPRTGTTGWSDNHALCVLDFMRSPWGPGIDDTEWDAAWWSAQANLADENVEYQPGMFQKRYTCNGTFKRDAAPLDTLEDMLNGVHAITYQEGKYKLHLAAYSAPTVTLTASDLRSDLEVVARPARRELFNAVKGTFVSPKNGYQPTDYPAVTNATYETQDNGERIFREMPLAFVDDEWEAQRLAKIALERHRQGITIRWPGKLTVLKVSAWQTVAVTLAEFGWSAKPFRVVSWEINEQSGAPDLFLQEEAAASYAWAYGEASTIDTAPDTNFTTPFDTPPAPTGLALFSGDAELDVREDGTVFSRLRVAWNDPGSVFVSLGGRTQIEYRKTGATDWLPGPFTPGDASGALILDVADGEAYDVRVRHETSLGVPSLWATQLGYIVEGKSAPPSAPSSLAVAQLADGSRKFDWLHLSVPADVSRGGGYRIRYALAPEQDWSDMTPLHTGVLTSSPYITVELTAGTYNFAIKSVDASGNESATASYALSVVLTDPPMAGALYFADERGQSWPGTLTSCFRDEAGVLRAISSGGWDNLAATWDALPATWDSLLAHVSPIRYETALIDLGAAVLAKPIISATANGTATVEMKAWTSGGEPGSWSAVGQSTARYWKIRVSVAGSTPQLSGLLIVLDAPSVSDFFNDLQTATEPSNSAFFYRAAAGDIYLAPRNGISVISVARINALQAVAGAWTWELVSKNAVKPGGWTNGPSSGPIAQLRIRNAAGTLADALIDVELRGPRG